jgi:hypothetical protein
MLTGDLAVRGPVPALAMTARGREGLPSCWRWEGAAGSAGRTESASEY